MQAIMQAAGSIDPQRRDGFLQRISTQLKRSPHGIAIGDDVIAAAIRNAWQDLETGG
jgi:uncharacterized protein (DUF2461 family)